MLVLAVSMYDDSSSSAVELPPHWERLATEVRLARDGRVFNPAAKLHKIGRFDGIKLIGVGGVGVVFEVYDPVLDRAVALKLCKNLGSGGGLALLHEARLLAKLAHPNVVTVHESGWHESGWHDNEVFYVMELVSGCSGHEYVRRCPSWEDAVEVYAGAGAGLAAAHDHGIVHGDFKPGNILLGNWLGDSRRRSRSRRVVVADFGLARVVAEHARKPPTLGTFEFTAPERLRGAPGDPRSDQFSYCVSLWELIYGTLPFTGETRAQLLESIERRDRRVDLALPDLPRRLRAILEQGLAIDPDRRHPTMHALVDALLDLRDRPLRRRSPRPRKRGRG